MVKIFVESANENAKNDFLGQLAKTFVKCWKKGLAGHPCSEVQREKKL